MNLKRRIYILKSRPQPLLAVLGLVLEVAVFIPLLWPNSGLLVRFSFLNSVWIVFILHAIASLLSGLAFPGWMGLRGADWAVPADASGAEAKALRASPKVDYVVRETGRSDEEIGDISRAKAPRDAFERRGEHRLGPLATCFALSFPILGSVTLLLVTVLRRIRARHYGDIIKEYRDLVDIQFRVLDLPPDVRDVAAERTWQAMELRPFVEILGSQGGDSDLTISAIESVGSLDVTQASRLLRHALSSRLPEARYSAAKALTRIEESLDIELQIAQEDHKFRPDYADPMMRIADARFNYGEIGESDDPLASFHYSEAIRYYEQCMGKIEGSEREECQSRLAMACLRVGQIEKAKNYYIGLVKDGSRLPSVLRGCVEACYMSRDYSSLRHYLKVAIDRIPDSEAIREVGRIWLENEETRDQQAETPTSA